MSSYYTVVRYVPDPISDERVNIGVLVFGDGRLRSRFLHDWRRVRSFGLDGIDFIRRFARDIDRAASQQQQLPAVPGAMDEEAVRTMIGGWINSIQLSEPKASVLPAGELLEDVADRYLRVPPRARRQFRDRRAAARLAAVRVEGALVERVGLAAHELLKRNWPVEGELDHHELDVVVERGQLYFTAHGLSFEGRETDQRARELQGVYWAVDDLHTKYPDLLIGIVAIPPKTRSDSYDHARRVLKSLDATVVDETEVAEWAREASRLVPVGG